MATTPGGSGGWFGGLFNSAPEPSPPPRPPLYPAANGSRMARSSSGPTRPASVESGMHRASSDGRLSRSAKPHQGASYPGRSSSTGQSSTADGLPGAAQLATVGEFSGHLHKLGSRVPTWKRRFFVLRPATYLYYYLSSGDEEPAGCINLDLYNECDDVADEEFVDPASQTPQKAAAPLQIYLQGAPRSSALRGNRNEDDNRSDDTGGSNIGDGYISHGEDIHDYEVGRGMVLTPPSTPFRSERARGSTSDDDSVNSTKISEAASRTASSSALQPSSPPLRPWGVLPPLPDNNILAHGGHGKRGYRSAKGWVSPRHAAAMERHQAAVNDAAAGLVESRGKTSRNARGDNIEDAKCTSKRPGARALRLRRPDTGQELVLVATSEEERDAWRRVLGPQNTLRGLKAQVERLQIERHDMQVAVRRLESELKEARDDARAATVGLQDEQRFYRRLLSELREDLGLGLEAMARHPSGRFGDAAARTAAANAEKARSSRTGSAFDSLAVALLEVKDGEVEAELVVKQKESKSVGLGELFDQLFKPMPVPPPPPPLGSDQVIAGGGPRPSRGHSSGSDTRTSVDSRSGQSETASSLSSFSGRRPFSPSELPPALEQQQQLEQRQGSFVDRILCAPGENSNEDGDDDDGTTSRGSSSLDVSRNSSHGAFSTSSSSTHGGVGGSGTHAASWLPPGWASRAEAQRQSIAARAGATAACGALLAAARQADASLGAARFDARATAAENRDLRAKLSRVAKHAKLLGEKQRMSASARKEQAQVLQRTVNERRALAHACRRFQREAQAARQAAATAATAAHEAAAKAAAASAQLALGNSFNTNEGSNGKADGSAAADIAAAAAVASATASAAAAAAVAASEDPSRTDVKREKSESSEGAKRVERVNTAPSLRLLRTLQAAFSPSTAPPETGGESSPQPSPMTLGPAAAATISGSAAIRPRPRPLELEGSYDGGASGSGSNSGQSSSGSAVAPFAYDARAFRQELRAAIGRAVDVAKPGCSPEPSYRSISNNSSICSSSDSRTHSSRADPSSLAAYTVGGDLQPREHDIRPISGRESNRSGRAEEASHGIPPLSSPAATATTAPSPQENSSSNSSHGPMDWLFKPHQGDNAKKSTANSTLASNVATTTSSFSSSSSSSSALDSSVSQSLSSSTVPGSNNDKGLLGSILGSFGFAAPSTDQSNFGASMRENESRKSSNNQVGNSNTSLDNSASANDGSNSEAGAVREFGRFAYRVVYRGGVGVRPKPDVQLPVSAASAIVPCGAAFVALERRIEGGLVYVRLGGWQPSSTTCSTSPESGDNPSSTKSNEGSGGGINSGDTSSIYDSELGPWINDAWGDGSTVGWVFEVSANGQRVLEPGAWLQEVTDRIQVSSLPVEVPIDESTAPPSTAEVTVAAAPGTGGLSAAAAVKNGGLTRHRGRFRGESDTDGHTDGSEEEVLAAATALRAAMAGTGSGEDGSTQGTGDGGSYRSVAGYKAVSSDGWPATSWEVSFFAKKIGIQFKGQKCKRGDEVVAAAGTASAASSVHLTSLSPGAHGMASDGVSTEAVPNTHRVVVAKLADCVVVGSDAEGAVQRMPLPGDAVVALNGDDLRGLSWKQVASRLNQANERPLRLRFDSALNIP